MYREGGFNLIKFTSNSKRVLKDTQSNVKDKALVTGSSAGCTLG